MLGHGMDRQGSKLPSCFLRRLSKLILAAGHSDAVPAVLSLARSNFHVLVLPKGSLLLSQFTTAQLFCWLTISAAPKTKVNPESVIRIDKIASNLKQDIV